MGPQKARKPWRWTLSLWRLPWLAEEVRAERLSALSVRLAQVSWSRRWFHRPLGCCWTGTAGWVFCGGKLPGESTVDGCCKPISRGVSFLGYLSC